MKLLITAPAKVLIVSVLVLQLFAMECLAEVSAPVVVSSQESFWEKVTAVENGIKQESIPNETFSNEKEINTKTQLLWEWAISKEGYSKIIPDGFESEKILHRNTYINWGAGIGFLVSLLIYNTASSNRSGYGIGMFGIIIIPSITGLGAFLGTLLDISRNKWEYQNNNICWVNSNDIDVIKDDNGIIDGIKKNYMFTLTKEINNDTPQEENIVGINNDIFNYKIFNKDSDRIIIRIKENSSLFDDYKTKNNIETTKNIEYRTVLDIKKYLPSLWHKVKFQEKTTFSYEKMKLFEGWLKEDAIETKGVKVGDYLYLAKRTALEQNPFFSSSFSGRDYITIINENDPCLVVGTKENMDSKGIGSVNKGLWYKIRVAKEE